MLYPFGPISLVEPMYRIGAGFGSLRRCNGTTINPNLGP